MHEVALRSLQRVTREAKALRAKLENAETGNREHLAALTSLRAALLASEGERAKLVELRDTYDAECEAWARKFAEQVRETERTRDERSFAKTQAAERREAIEKLETEEFRLKNWIAVVESERDIARREYKEQKAATDIVAAAMLKSEQEREEVARLLQHECELSAERLDAMAALATAVGAVRLELAEEKNRHAHESLRLASARATVETTLAVNEEQARRLVIAHMVLQVAADAEVGVHAMAGNEIAEALRVLREPFTKPKNGAEVVDTGTGPYLAQTGVERMPLPQADVCGPGCAGESHDSPALDGEPTHDEAGRELPGFDANGAEV